MHTERKQRCDARGTSYKVKTNFKGQVLSPNATNKKVFSVDRWHKIHNAGTKQVPCKNKRVRDHKDERCLARRSTKTEGRRGAGGE